MAEALLRCSNPACQRERARADAAYACASCQGLLDVVYDLQPQLAADWPGIWEQRRQSMTVLDRSGVWRFRELLPSLEEPGALVSMAEGNTPLVETPKTGQWAGVERLAVKHQGSNPTGSFKDIGMTVCVTEAVQRRARALACASTGNTSASMAAYAARAGLRAVVFVPKGAVSGAKLAQAIDFGALVVETGENFDQAFGLLRQVAPELSLYLVNSINPFRIEGQKTMVLEVLEQRQWRTPDYIVLPGGNLGNVSAAGKCLSELAKAGLLARLPRLVVVQAQGASPFHQMWSAHRRRLVPNPAPVTRATAIRIGSPANWPRAVRALEWTEGITEAVTDEEIRTAKAALASDGVGCEPASAATAAGIRKLRHSGAIEADADVVAILTGHQLKDTDYILEQSSVPTRPGVVDVGTDPGAVREALQGWLK